LNRKQKSYAHFRRHRGDLARIMRIEQNRLEHATLKTVRLSPQCHVRSITREMDGLDKRITGLVAVFKEGQASDRYGAATKQLPTFVACCRTDNMRIRLPSTTS